MLPYPFQWGRGTIQRHIRERDGHVCRLCNAPKPAKRGHDIHHIDYDKFNLSESNLITLCRSCHSKTNYYREKWLAVFASMDVDASPAVMQANGAV